MDPDTSKPAKEVHQQCSISVDDALAFVDDQLSIGRKPDDYLCVEFGQLATLAAEVRRLRAENGAILARAARGAALVISALGLREAISVMSTNEGKLHARIAELETQLSAERGNQGESR